MKTDTNTLLALCEKTDNDIRSCLNTLQVSRQSSWEFTEKLLFLMESVHTIYGKHAKTDLFLLLKIPAS